MIPIECPHCSCAMRFADTEAGKIGACLQCRQRFLIPQPATVELVRPNPGKVVVTCPVCDYRGEAEEGVRESGLGCFGALILFPFSLAFPYKREHYRYCGECGHKFGAFKKKKPAATGSFDIVAWIIIGVFFALAIAFFVATAF